jgi:hypothetical protein
VPEAEAVCQRQSAGPPSCVIQDAVDRVQTGATVKARLPTTTRIKPSDLRAQAEKLIADGMMPDLDSLLDAVAQVRTKEVWDAATATEDAELAQEFIKAKECLHPEGIQRRPRRRQGQNLTQACDDVQIGCSDRNCPVALRRRRAFILCAYLVRALR